jgi:hypothetical protein
MRNSIGLSFLAFLSVAAAAFGAPSGPSPSISITPTKITATGLTPGAQVLFFGAGFEPKNGQAILHRWSAVVPDDDKDGAVTFDPGMPVTWNALWIVADLRNAHYAIAATPGFPIAREYLARREFKRDASAVISHFVYARANADVLYLTAGGAWTMTAQDGAPADSDGKTNGATEIDVSRFQPVAGANPAPAFTPGGTLFVIDPSRLDLLELRLDGSLLAGAR